MNIIEIESAMIGIKDSVMAKILKTMMLQITIDIAVNKNKGILFKSFIGFFYSHDNVFNFHMLIYIYDGLLILPTYNDTFEYYLFHKR